MLIAAASHSHWYTSGTFYAAAGVIAVVVIGGVTVWATLFAGSIKRRLSYSLADDTPLLARTTALAQGDLEVLYQGQRLDQPRVVSIRLVSRGRRDIGSDDFDQDRPLAIDLGVPIVKRLTSEPAPEIPQSAIRVEGTRLLLGPCLIRRRRVMSFAFLVDGGRPRLSHESYLLNVDVRESADSRELRPWMLVALGAAGPLAASVGFAASAQTATTASAKGSSVTTAELTVLAVVAFALAATVAVAVRAARRRR